MFFFFFRNILFQKGTKMAMWADNVKFVKDIIDSKYQKIDSAITEVIIIFYMIGIAMLKLCVKHSNLKWVTMWRNVIKNISLCGLFC